MSALRGAALLLIVGLSSGITLIGFTILVGLAFGGVR